MKVLSVFGLILMFAVGGAFAQTTQSVPANQTEQPAQTVTQQPTQTQAAVPPQVGPACKADDASRKRVKSSCGTVLDANGQPVSGLTLDMVSAGQNNSYVFVMAETITDKNGHFDFGPVPSGHYLLRTWAGAPATVFNFIGMDEQIARVRNNECKGSIEIKAAAAGSCDSKVESGKNFSLNEAATAAKAKPDQKNQAPKQQTNSEQPK